MTSNISLSSEVYLKIPLEGYFAIFHNALEVCTVRLLPAIVQNISIDSLRERRLEDRRLDTFLRCPTQSHQEKRKEDFEQIEKPEIYICAVADILEEETLRKILRPHCC